MTRNVARAGDGAAEARGGARDAPTLWLRCRGLCLGSARANPAAAARRPGPHPLQCEPLVTPPRSRGLYCGSQAADF